MNACCSFKEKCTVVSRSSSFVPQDFTVQSSSAPLLCASAPTHHPLVGPGVCLLDPTLSSADSQSGSQVRK